MLSLFKEKYDPSELRISKGNKGGGRWTKIDKPSNDIKIKDEEVNKLNPEELRDDIKFRYFMYLEMIGFNNCEIVGRPTHRYNCIAWAFGDNTRWWWPAYEAFWPEECLVEDENSYSGIDEVKSFEKLFEYIGAEETTNDKPEKGYVKLAVYKGARNYKHMARLLPDGQWTSKMGDCAKVVNRYPEDLAGGVYGNVSKIIKIPTEKWATMKDME